MTPKELIEGIGELASMPSVALRISEMADDENYSAADIGKVIMQDPGLTARLLRIANSPLYGFSNEIDTVSRAVTVLGTKQVRDLVVATAAVHAFDGLPNELITMENFWRDSIACGLAARLLIGKQRLAQGESIFIACLLHDIGELVIFNKLPEQARQALDLTVAEMDGLPLDQAEQKILGFDHSEVGGELIKQWRLPNSLYECVAFHHNPGAAIEFQYEVAVIHIANALAVMAELDCDDIEDADVPPIDPLAWEITGLDMEDAVATVVPALREQLDEVCTLFAA